MYFVMKNLTKQKKPKKQREKKLKEKQSSYSLEHLYFHKNYTIFYCTFDLTSVSYSVIEFHSLKRLSICL